MKLLILIKIFDRWFVSFKTSVLTKHWNIIKINKKVKPGLILCEYKPIFILKYISKPMKSSYINFLINRNIK